MFVKTIVVNGKNGMPVIDEVGESLKGSSQSVLSGKEQDHAGVRKFRFPEGMKSFRGTDLGKLFELLGQSLQVQSCMLDIDVP